MTTNQKIQIIGAVVLLLCILPLPYGFFTIVRVVITFISLYFAYEYFTNNKKGLALTFAVIAVLFQPFVKLPLGREVWLVVDIIVAILLLFLAFKKE